MISLSILDYSPVDEGSNDRMALQQTAELARAADRLGYHRFWVSEHHYLPPLAGSNPELLMMHLANQTEHIRIGSGGVMLPNYSAYKIAENFRMLEALHPGRIDLGAGRAAGAGRIGKKALNEGRTETVPYEQQLIDLIRYLNDEEPADHRFPGLKATPVIDTQPELWMLGTGRGGAELAADHGTGLAFAHFINASSVGRAAMQQYQANFRSSTALSAPRGMVGIFVTVADTEEEAEQLARSWDYWLLMSENKGQRLPFFPSPATIESHDYSTKDLEVIARNRRRMIVGTADSVREGIEELAADYAVQEVLLLPLMYGFHNRMRAIEQLAAAFGLSQTMQPL
ncbi:LLM class flavin-dependent oxidoreductase [Paenibacillus shenyangensis]|uniref:LLM class flavin-dependent oxidoreductase n=1 Tax=Paenibacillus sp. A9 TaxID=1284352 RepID=UPI00037D6408|nr:LLM class flavin-dependent oxidoreductase [Paenibacillus sp. A9]